METRMNVAINKLAEQQRSFLSSTQNSSMITGSELRLPALNIPTFTGNYQDFPEFRDLYEASVHNNEKLPTSHKFQYLKGLLKDEAAALIKHIQLSDVNYDEAWNKIVERYDKKRHIIATLIQKFTQQSVVSSKDGSLRKLCDTSDEVLRGLRALGREAETRNPWVIHIMLQKINNEMKQKWAHHSANKEFPTVEEFMEFLTKQCDAIETYMNDSKPTSTIITSSFIRSHSIQTPVSSNNTRNCIVCNGDHYINNCKQFVDMNPKDRRELALNKGACFNCLSTNHIKQACRSRFTCRICRKRHHTMLHAEINLPDSKTNSLHLETTHAIQHQSSPAAEGTQTMNSIINRHLELNNFNSTMEQVTVLPTAKVLIENYCGERIPIRVLLDSGSQASFINESCVRKLQLKRANARIAVHGLATSGVFTQGVVNLSIHSRTSPEKKPLSIEAFVLNKLTSSIPSQNLHINRQDLSYLQHLSLADPDYNKPGEIDVLIGADHFFRILQNGQISSSNHKIIAQNSMYGWIISGVANSDIDHSKLHNFNLGINIDETLRKFWEIEEIENHVTHTVDEQLALQHFEQTHNRRTIYCIVAI